MLRAQRAVADGAAPARGAASSWILRQHLRELCSPEESSGSSPLEQGPGANASARAQRRMGPAPGEKQEEQDEATSCSSGSSDEVVCSPRSSRQAGPLSAPGEGPPSAQAALADAENKAPVLPAPRLPTGSALGADSERQRAGAGCCAATGGKRSLLSPGIAAHAGEEMPELALQRDCAVPAGPKRARTDAALELPNPNKLALLLLLRHSMSPAKGLQQGSQQQHGREDDKGSCIQRANAPVCSVETRSDGCLPGAKAGNVASDGEYECMSRSDMSIVESLFNEEDRCPQEDEASSR